MMMASHALLSPCPPPRLSLCRTLSASLPLLANFDFSLCTCCTGMHAHVLDSIWRYPFQILSFPSPSNYHFLTVLTKPMHRWKHPIFIWQCVGNLSKGHQTCVSLWLHFFFQTDSFFSSVQIIIIGPTGGIAINSSYSALLDGKYL